MSVVVITGSSGLIGSEAVRAFAACGYDVVGIENDMRRYFFGDEASVRPESARLRAMCPTFREETLDVRNQDAIRTLFARFGRAISVVIHAAAQPSHDWAAREPLTDFHINATGTLHLLEAARAYCPEAVFILTSTNKVYGDTPNRLPFVELDTRWELDPSHPFHARGIDESMSIDQTLHSLFGASKLAADVLAQEYGRYFGMKTAIFRCGCLTGPHHAGAELHGFLAYMMKCAVIGREYRIFGYKGKQVRDNLHAADLADAFLRVADAPRAGEVYNMGGGRASHCSLCEAMTLCEQISGRALRTQYVEQPRVGDQIWYISDTRKFEAHYPGWRVTRDVRAILQEIHDANADGWRSSIPPA